MTATAPAPVGFWEGPGGGREVLRIGYPLILAQLSFTLQTFVDRLFLTWYSAEAVAGAVTALFVVWTYIGVCIGTGEYVTSFVAQYLGAGRPERVGAAMWQGLWFALASGVGGVALTPLAEPVFAFAGHSRIVQQYEVTYAQVLLLGTLPVVAMATLSAFFAGRGRTLVVLVVNVAVTAVNAVLDYLWIFGHGGFERAGVAGAAAATIASQAFGALCFFALMVRRPNREAYRTLADWRLEAGLFRRLVRLGVPAGLHYALEIFAFALFMFMVGRLGTAELAATGIAFNLNMIVFTPMLGLGFGVAALVSKALGAGDVAAAERATWSGFKMSFVYMGACGALYVLVPELLLAPYAAGSAPGQFARIGELSVVLLRFVAFYSIFDMANVIFAAALKGAGDTAFPLRASVVASSLGMLLPTWVLCFHLGYGLYAAWGAATFYVFLVGVAMLVRFRRGDWRTLRVVEELEPGADELAAAEK